MDEKILKICHNVNRAFSLGVGETVSVDDLYENANEEKLEELKLIVSSVIEKKDIKIEEIHEAFLNHRIKQGFVFAMEENKAKKVSPRMVRFCDLSIEHRTRYYVIKELVLNLLDK